MYPRDLEKGEKKEEKHSKCMHRPIKFYLYPLNINLVVILWEGKKEIKRRMYYKK
jgi:hypothetical protein